MKRVSAGTVTAGVIAIVLGLAAAYVARHTFSSQPEAARQGVPVVIARVNLPKHMRIRPEDLRVIDVPAAAVPEGALRQPSVAANRFARTDITAGQPVLADALYAIGETPSLAEELPPGHRAVTIHLDGDHAGGGLVKPGALVDIALTVEGNHPDLGTDGRTPGIGTLTLLRGVRVLAAGDQVAGLRTRSGTRTTMTVSATPEQANRLILAQRYGSLSVTLVSAQEAMLSAADADAPAAAARPHAEEAEHLVNPRTLLGLGPVPPPKTAVIWRGNKAEVISFEPAHVAEAAEATVATLRRQTDERTEAIPASIRSEAGEDRRPQPIDGAAIDLSPTQSLLVRINQPAAPTP